MGSCYSSMAKMRMDDVGGSVMEQEANVVATLSGSPSRRHKWRKKSGGGVDHESLLLNFIPGRIVSNGGSKISCLHTQQGKKGTNQDSMIVWENFSKRSDAVFCGVFDGHGPLGHMVSRKVRDSLPVILNTQWASSLEQSSCFKSERGSGTMNLADDASGSVDDDLLDVSEVEEAQRFPETHLPLKKSLFKAFKLMDKELRFQSTIDCFCSGTTAVTLVKQGQDLVIANVGDSRAVLATRDQDGSLLAIQLTVDLKPDLPREAARIQQCKGRVFALQDEPEVARVWLPNNDSPGLAMARAFGDFCLKDFGLISVPDVYYCRLTERDEFIILATDGVWDVLSNKEAVDIVASAPSHATAARALVDSAVRAWRLKYPTSKNDDCAAVCLFLEHPSEVSGEEDAKGSTISKPPSQDMMKASDDNAERLQVRSESHASVLQQSDKTQSSVAEIVPVNEAAENKLLGKHQGQSKRSLAECISIPEDEEDEEWSALEGITRVNSLLSIPRFLSGDRRSTGSWRKWL